MERVQTKAGTVAFGGDHDTRNLKAFTPVCASTFHRAPDKKVPRARWGPQRNPVAGGAAMWAGVPFFSTLDTLSGALLC